LSPVEKIAFVALQLLPAVPVLTATVDLQKKGQVNEYKGESKFLIATKTMFSAARGRSLFPLPHLLASSEVI
jgi:hypothetical protein